MVICVGALQPLVVVWLQLAAGITVREPPALATKTFPSGASRATASGCVPVCTEPAFTNDAGLFAFPSLITLTVLLPLLATYRVEVEGSTAWATGLEPVGRRDLPVDVAAL